VDAVTIDVNSLFGVGFILWAGVIAYFGKRILKKLDDTADALNDYIVQTETRLAVVEDRLKINHP